MEIKFTHLLLSSSFAQKRSQICIDILDEENKQKANRVFWKDANWQQSCFVGQLS